MLFNDQIVDPKIAAPAGGESAAANAAGQPVAPANSYRPSGPRSLKITGEIITSSGANSANLNLLAVHTSLPLVRVLKGLNDFSNNWMAGIIGDLVGGPEAVERFLENTIGLKPEEV